MDSIKYCSLIVTLLCIVVVKANYECGIRKNSFVPLVHHGWKVEPGQWPWHVGVFNKLRNGSTDCACGGTLFNRRYVLTVAHCVVYRGTSRPRQAADLLLHFGKSDPSTGENHVQKRDVDEIVVHPEFSKFKNDIAVLVLQKPVEYTDFVIPICLEMRVDKDLRSLVGTRGWIAGWGNTQKGTSSSELRSASMPVVDYLQCMKNDPTLFVNVLNPYVFCAGDRNGTSPGLGDSGSGMYFSDGDRWILKGMVFFGKINEATRQVDSSKYTVFVNVQRYFRWIQEITEDRNSNSTAGGVVKRISEKECERFKSFATKRSDGTCSNDRFHHTISLLNGKGKHICSGVLVNENHVLTSCFCQYHLPYFTPATMVRVGGYGNVNISSFVCHPAHTYRGLYLFSSPLVSAFNHDVAIARLESPVKLSFNIIPACLASNWTENLHDALVTTGFRTSLNKFSETDDAVHFFENDDIQVLTADDCNRNAMMINFNEYRKYTPEGEDPAKRTVVPTQLCVTNKTRPAVINYRTTGSDGAPLQTVNTWTCMFTVIGVANFDYSESDSMFLSIFTRVSYYLDWIEETVWGVEKSPSNHP